jgi:prenyltransferase beta subunit
MGTTGNLSAALRRNEVMTILLKRRISRVSHSPQDIQQIKGMTLSVVERLRVKHGQYGQYHYSNSSKIPTLYASIYACLVRQLYGDLDQLTETQRRDWIEYINRHQDGDGLFKDPNVQNSLADSVDWWGWRHLTLHVIMALTALRTVPRNRLRFLREFGDEQYAVKWLKTRDWSSNIANVSNEIQNYTALLQYARDFQNEQWAASACKTLLNELSKMQDPVTGLWGGRVTDAAQLSNAVQAGYHFWLLFFYDHIRIGNYEKVVESCLRTQNMLGGFSPFHNSSACEDIDSIDPLVRLYFAPSSRNDEIKKAMRRALPWILLNMNSDGGFVFRRYEPLIYGNENLYSGINETALFPTWFRSLSLALINNVLRDAFKGQVEWGFIDAPGYQFWRA